MMDKPKKRAGNPEWVKGVSGNPRGKGAGTRDKISRAFLTDMAEAWEKYGIKALKEMATNDPTNFVKTFAALLPKEVKVEAHESMTDEQLVTRIRELSSELGVEGALFLVGGSETGETTH